MNSGLLLIRNVMSRDGHCYGLSPDLETKNVFIKAFYKASLQPWLKTPVYDADTDDLVYDWKQDKVLSIYYDHVGALSRLGRQLLNTGDKGQLESPIVRGMQSIIRLATYDCWY